jgi:hypothetical protein
VRASAARQTPAPCLGAAGTGTVQAGAGGGTRRSMSGGGTAHRITPGRPARLNRARAKEAYIAARHRCGVGTGAARPDLCGCTRGVATGWCRQAGSARRLRIRAGWWRWDTRLRGCVARGDAHGAV